MDQIEFFKVVAGLSSAAAVGAVASHVKVRERVARLEERVAAIGEKVDAALGGGAGLATNARPPPVPHKPFLKVAKQQLLTLWHCSTMNLLHL